MAALRNLQARSIAMLRGWRDTLPSSTRRRAVGAVLAGLAALNLSTSVLITPNAMLAETDPTADASAVVGILPDIRIRPIETDVSLRWAPGAALSHQQRPSSPIGRAFAISVLPP